MEQELITLGILFFFALIGGVLASRFKQPVLLGLLFVGAIIGPNAVGLIKDSHLLEPMIEFGAILMLFVLGLEFDLSKLKKIGAKSILIATLNSAVLTFVGFMVSMLLGLSVQISLFIGVVVSFGSTVIIVKVLENKGMMDRQEVPLLVAILIVEDILAVMVITFFSGMVNKEAGLIGNIEHMIVSMVILILGYMLFVKFIKPMLAWIIKGNNSEEVTTFMALALCAGFAYFAYYLKLSPAVGAFMAGSIVASLPNAKEFEKAISPYNLIISSFFFIAIGTLINFSAIREYAIVILILVLTVFITKIIAFSGLVYFFANMRGDKMFFSSIAMFSVGEFSLLVAKESLKFNLGIDLISISAAIVVISAILMSLTISHSNKMYAPTMENMPYSIRKKIEKVAEYIKSVSEEMDLDNKYSQTLKKNIGKTIQGIMLLLLLIFGWRKISTFLSLKEINTTLISTGYVVALIAIAISMFYTILMTRKVVKSISEIFSNATNTRSIIQSKNIVVGTFKMFTTLITILSFPFIMFMFELSKIYLLVPLGLLILLIWQMHKISSYTKNDSMNNYMHHETVNYNSKYQGWKI